MPECVVTVVYEAFAVEDVLMTCPLATGVCTYTVAARPDTAVVVVVNAPVQAVVMVVNDTVAGAVWTGATVEDDEDEVVDATEEDEEVDATEEDDEDDDFVDDEAIEDEEDEETIEADDEMDELLEVTEEAEDDDEETELDDEDENTDLEEDATLDEEEGMTLAMLDKTDVGRTAILDDDDDEGAGQLIAFELMLSATLVRLKYASILRIFNTLSEVGGP